MAWPRLVHDTIKLDSLNLDIFLLNPWFFGTASVLARRRGSRVRALAAWREVPIGTHQRSLDSVVTRPWNSAFLLKDGIVEALCRSLEGNGHQIVTAHCMYVLLWIVEVYELAG